MLSPVAFPKEISGYNNFDGIGIFKRLYPKPYTHTKCGLSIMFRTGHFASKAQGKTLRFGG